MSTRQEEINNFIINNVEEHSNDIAKFTAQHFGISVQAVNSYIRKLLADNILISDGNTKARRYELRSDTYSFVYELKPNISESNIWHNDIEKYMPQKPNVRHICSYGFTEIFNNAIDHSQGTQIGVDIIVNPVNTTMLIYDNGVGIFRNIKNKFNLLNEREAILELSKGKLTTNKQKHSGEGIFFTSRAFDDFFIMSYGITFAHSEEAGGEIDILVDDRPNTCNGTCVTMKIANDSNRVLTDVFDRFAGEDYGFDKTVIPIQLARYGDDNLLSRSQAKRVLARANLFKSILFDFKDVPSIGQAFADEIFRVFASEHPDIELMYGNANRDVENMIKRAKISNISNIDN